MRNEQFPNLIFFVVLFNYLSALHNHYLTLKSTPFQNKTNCARKKSVKKFFFGKVLGIVDPAYKFKWAIINEI